MKMSNNKILRKNYQLDILHDSNYSNCKINVKSKRPRTQYFADANAIYRIPSSPSPCPSSITCFVLTVFKNCKKMKSKNQI